MIKNSLIIGIMAIIIVLLLINVYQQNNQIQALQNTCNSVPETMTTVGDQNNGQNTGTTGSNSGVPQNQNKNRIVLYYTNWCGFSKQFFPIWSAFETRNGDKIIIEKVDCETSKCDVNGFPTVKMYKLNGEVINFDGPRTVEGLETFIANN